MKTNSFLDDLLFRGYTVLPAQIPESLLDWFESKFITNLMPANGVKSVHEPLFADRLLDNRELEQFLYTEVRNYPWLREVAYHTCLAEPMRELIGDKPIGLLSKIPLRIDLPGVLREYAHWHQDWFYVGGSINTLTAWIPLQDIDYEIGPVKVALSSHRLGALCHNRRIGKRDYVDPSAINKDGGLGSPSGYPAEFRYIPMRRGDVLVLHAFTLHSSSVNFSNRARLSIQARYQPLTDPVGPTMGRLIPL